MIALLADLQEMIDTGYVTARKHSSNDCSIYNYTRKTLVEQNWNSVTMLCRGLILDAAGRIIARPFAKFFDYSQLRPEQIPDEPFEVYEKLDGSLGILYKYNGEFAIATRGSFDNAGAKEGTAWIQQHTAALMNLPDNVTLLFEMIGGRHRIVLDYGEIQRLVLLAAVDNETGEDVPLPDVGFERVQQYEGIKTLDELLEHPILKNTSYELLREGFVLRYSSGMRMKVKNAEYLRLHSILTGTTSRRIWELTKTMEGIESLVTNVPGEFKEWVFAQIDTFNQQCEQRLRQYFQILLHEIYQGGGGKDAILSRIKTHPKSHILFRFRDIHDRLWEEIKPEITTFSNIR